MSSKHEESNEQQSLIKWAWLSRTKYPGLERMFHIPNGQLLGGSGTQRMRRGARLKAEGLKAGVPDLFLPVPIAPYSGLFIEMKRKKGGRLSKEQKDWCEWLPTAGYRLAVCNGFLEAKAVIKDYYGESNDPA